MKANKIIGTLIAMFFLSPASALAGDSNQAREHESGSLECIINNRETDTPSTATVTYSGPFNTELTKDMNLEIWYKPGTLTVFLPNQKVRHDWVKVYFDGHNEEVSSPIGFSGIAAVAQFASGRFDAFKWGFWMGEISCAHTLKTP